MTTTEMVQDDRYCGNKGFAEASPATLTRRLLQYEGLAGDVTVPSALRDYSAAVIAELHAELARRAPRMEAA